jgi:hypothetical protein
MSLLIWLTQYYEVRHYAVSSCALSHHRSWAQVRIFLDALFWNTPSIILMCRLNYISSDNHCRVVYWPKLSNCARGVHATASENCIQVVNKHFTCLHKPAWPPYWGSWTLLEISGPMKFSGCHDASKRRWGRFE